MHKKACLFSGQNDMFEKQNTNKVDINNYISVHHDGTILEEDELKHVNFVAAKATPEILVK